MKSFSKEAQDIINVAKEVAERFNNNFISVGHFLLCFNRFNQNGKLKIKISFKEKKYWIKYLKEQKFNNIKNDDYPLTKQMEEGLRTSYFHCKIMEEKFISPEHIYLGILASKMENKNEYLKLLENYKSVSRLQSLLINLYFNKFLRKIKLYKFLY